MCMRWLKLLLSFSGLVALTNVFGMASRSKRELHGPVEEVTMIVSGRYFYQHKGAEVEAKNTWNNG